MTKDKSAVPSQAPELLTSVAEYSKTAAALAELRLKYQSVLFDVKTKEGMATAIRARAELRKYRLDLEKLRIEIKAPALEKCQQIDSEARRITAELAALEDPIDDQIKADERRKQAEAEAKARAEAEAKEKEERERRETEERVAAAQRAEIARQQAELAAKQRAQEEAEAESKRRIEADHAATRERIEREQREAREKIEAEEREAAAKRQRIEMLRQEIQGIRQQSIIAQSGRLGVRVGGTISCIEETLAETEVWPIDESHFAEFAGEAKQAKADAIATIKLLLDTARRRKAEEDQAAAARADADRKQEEERQRIRAQEEQVAKDKRELEEKQRLERLAQEERDRQAREAEEARQREIDRAANELLDAKAMLEAFREKFGKLPEFAGVIKAIEAYLKVAKS